jgi:hypothetical protein
MAKKIDTEGSENWPEFRNISYVRASYDAERDVYVVQGSRGDAWEVAAADFHEYYKPTTPNKS